MPQVVLMLKMPCDSTSWTGTQVANHSWLLALAKSWTGSRRFNALMSRVLGASPLRQWANEQSNILTDTGKTENQQDQPPDRDPSTTPRRGPYFPCDICPQYGIISTVMIPAVSSGATWTLSLRNFLWSWRTQVQSTFATLLGYYANNFFFWFSKK